MVFHNLSTGRRAPHTPGRVGSDDLSSGVRGILRRALGVDDGGNLQRTRLTADNGADALSRQPCKAAPRERQSDMARARLNLEITPQVVLRAYSLGLFPMSESADDKDLFWVEPEARGVFPLDGLIVTKSLAKMVRSDRYEIRADSDFDAVIDACAGARSDGGGTWINGEIRRLYRQLFDLGHVHTIEAYQDGALVGGLYGVSLGAAFFGESMFHRARDASKVALVHLAARLVAGGYRLLDTQFVTPHLASLGAVEISRAHYRTLLDDAISHQGEFDALPLVGVSGRAALTELGLI